VYHNFYKLLVATKSLTAQLYSCYVMESESGVGSGNFVKWESVSETLERLESDILPLTP